MILLNKQFVELLKEYKINKGLVLSRAPRPQKYTKNLVPTNTLVLTTKCGKKVHVFHGATIRNTLKVAEREYFIEEMIRPYLRKFSKILNEYMENLQEPKLNIVQDDMLALLASMNLKRYPGLRNTKLMDRDPDDKKAVPIANIQYTPKSADTKEHITYKVDFQSIKEAQKIMDKLIIFPESAFKKAWRDYDQEYKRIKDRLDHITELLQRACEI